MLKSISVQIKVIMVMKVLWITNILFPEAQKRLTGKGVLKSSGGWMTASADYLVKSEGISLVIATVSPLVDSLTVIQGECIKYYVLPYGKGNKYYNPEYEPLFDHIQQKEKPDVVHIHGTEFTHGLAYVNACGNRNVVVSIQGLKSVISKYYMAGLSFKDRIRNTTIRDLIKGGIDHEAKEYARQGKNEVELIQKVKHVIGRTLWDKTHTWVYNYDLRYHHCEETLRPEFYSSRKWTYSQCQKHSIFLSQAWYPLKGAHQVIKAAAILVQLYPDLQIRIAGEDVTRFANLRGLSHYTTYARYLSRLIRQYDLHAKVKFLGALSTQQMVDEYLNCNVFVCPSSIENSPNSLGEAQILGTPCIASYVGGIPDMMRGNEENLFRFEEVEMLAEKIRRVFSDKEKQTDMSTVAANRHHPLNNNKQLLSIYKEIIEG